MDISSIEKNINVVNLINSIPGGLCIYSLKNQCPYIEFSVWNTYMSKITGYTIEEINEKGFYNIFSIEEEGRKFITNFIDEKKYR